MSPQSRRTTCAQRPGGRVDSVSDKAMSLLIGAGFLALTMVLFIRRRWLARVTCGYMFPVMRDAQRDQKQVQVERLLRIVLGVFFPAFTVLWMLLVVLQ